MIRALIVGDHPLMIDGIRAVLEADHEFEVVGTASSPGAALAMARADTPDVALVDARFKGESGGDLVAELRHASPLMECLVMSVSDDADTFREALSHGAHGYVLDDASREDIRLAVRRVASGRSHIDPGVSGYLVQATHAGEHPTDTAVTAREIDVLRLAAQGMTNTAIADHLDITAETVKTHLSRAFERLGARDRANAVAICMRRGLF